MFWQSVAIPLLVGGGLSLVLELLLQPKILPLWKRPRLAFYIHFGLWLLVFAFELALFRRPWFAAANVLAIQFFLVLVNNAKFQSLQEPFIYQDFEYFTDSVKHPRLYIPFFGLTNILLATICFLSALFAGLYFEPSLFDTMPASNLLMVLLALGGAGVALLLISGRKRLKITLDPGKDLRQLGLLASLWFYRKEERVPFEVPSSKEYTAPVLSQAEKPPHLVVVQSESFFDIRDILSDIRPEILQQYDLLKSEAVCQGKLDVPGWGANTVRTEFAFLAGLAPEILGVHCFNPYRILARQGVPTLVKFLKKRGYRTVCVHPYPASFYCRDKVFPLLGFDEFIDIESFEGVEKSGPYVSDIALAEKIRSLLDDSKEEQLFIFAITMENHGPLHLEKVIDGEVDQFYLKPPPEGYDDLTIYLRHLRNGDRMVGMLRDTLKRLPGPGWLCWFGDHVPIMPKVYKMLQAPEGKTDYCIWTKDGNSLLENRIDMRVENLGKLLLRKMGLINLSD